MSKAHAGARAQSARNTSEPSKSALASATADHPAFKPHKKLFMVLMIVLALWVGILVALYVTTVRGRQPGDKPASQTNHPHPSLPTRAYRA